MPVNAEIAEAAEVMIENGFDIHPYLVKQVFNRENEKVFAAVVQIEGQIGLSIYTPNFEPSLKVVKF